MRNIILLTGIIGLLLGTVSCSKKSVDPPAGGGGTVTPPPITIGKALPAGAGDGVTYINSGASAIFNIYAPGKTSMAVIGEFNNWLPTAMTVTPDGNNWWVQIDNLDANKEYTYQFLSDGTLKVADPYCEKVLDPDNDKYIPASVYPDLKPYPAGQTGIVSVMQGNQPAYAWKNASFTRPDKNKLVIYELHMRDFVGTHSYKTLKDTLSYLTNLGINAIELMPINEFEGNSSWGYNPSFYFAVDKYYGTKNDLKALIDECHSRGIAVILDMVLNHSFGQSPMVQLYFDKATQKPRSTSPWFNVNPTHPYNVGYDFNHESPATKYFAKNVMKFYMQQYKIDGYRFDLAKGFTQKTSTDDASFAAYDASRVAIWNEYNSFIKSIDNNNFYNILEFFGGDREEKELSDAGMMLWCNINYNFNEATMGYVPTSNFSRLYFTSHTGFTQPDNLVTYMESHDEERLMYKNLQYGNVSGSYSVKTLPTALAREEAAAAFLLTAPGPKMIWQFGELGYDISIDQNGRTGEKPIHWEYNSDPLRHRLYATYAKLIRMKIRNPVFATSSISSSSSGSIKTVYLNGTGENVVVAGNFDVNSQSATVAFPSAGTWYDYMTGGSINVTLPYTVTYGPGEYHIYSNVVLK
ncbi:MULTISPECIES: alpha-amylase family glycosyl hydrolase [unclassified Mucilaginibacter]|uniref:alpha-amylase family glycosyl hydrolase n=1 Tax=unclassified Mucilaginibacter TaxID=2617802 RepID=UPI002AC9590A|nr:MULTISPECIES: alpha-amylase family glycosyl hydrolase [unclassified Mucilaginibacter]MEB0262928.1 alpha-amylase family glycosyl hydrolase [Mucilaginibacter sp. 10I4]MEB0278223.1 alpha-amylase family glycosyl hydrolase [Mucilaginibacter sp. 10B2]MEB0300991.1 alpha-amylase family glycosyl hydrolase [Mucilaginibacter sp. 5C4]WPX23868.1 alpha-amylase family glycosyl hydrolase [Mucilaginibacter sp. 5C4]